MPGLCCGCWDLSSGALIVEQMLLTTELCLSPTALLSSVLFFFLGHQDNFKKSIFPKNCMHYRSNDVSTMCLGYHSQYFWEQFLPAIPWGTQGIPAFYLYHFKGCLSLHTETPDNLYIFNRNSHFGTHVNSQTPQIFFFLSLGFQATREPEYLEFV